METAAFNSSSREAVTQLLIELSGGSKDAVNRIIPLVYDDLRQIAHEKLHFERPNHTLNTTALVHEAYFRLIDQQRVEWKNRAHFYAIVAIVMRRILVNYAALRRAERRGGGAAVIPLDESLDAGLTEFSDDRVADVLAIDGALKKLEKFNERGCRIVEYRFFGGLTYEEIAQAMDLSAVTVRRSWSAAKSWLRRELKSERQ